MIVIAVYGEKELLNWIRFIETVGTTRKARLDMRRSPI